MATAHPEPEGLVMDFSHDEVRQIIDSETDVGTALAIIGAALAATVPALGIIAGAMAVALVANRTRFGNADKGNGVEVETLWVLISLGLLDQMIINPIQPGPPQPNPPHIFIAGNPSLSVLDDGSGDIDTSISNTYQVQTAGGQFSISNINWSGGPGVSLAAPNTPNAQAIVATFDISNIKASRTFSLTVSATSSLGDVLNAGTTITVTVKHPPQKGA